MPDPLLDELLALATAAATAAAVVLRPEFGRDRSNVTTKSSSTDMVSEMDRAAEHSVVTVIRNARPEDAILAEEGTARRGSSGVRWVIDPLDGTTNYLFGVPAYGVSVAAEIDGVTVVGVVVDPSRQETWQAARGRGAWLNTVPLHLPVPAPALPPLELLARALIATGFSYRPERRAYQAALLLHLLPRVRDIRRFGAAAVDLCWVAGGRFSGFYELDLQPWDLAAGVLIAEEAGADVAALTDGTTVVAAPGLLGPLVTLLEEATAKTPGE